MKKFSKIFLGMLVIPVVAKFGLNDVNAGGLSLSSIKDKHVYTLQQPEITKHLIPTEKRMTKADRQRIMDELCKNKDNNKTTTKKHNEKKPNKVRVKPVQSELKKTRTKNEYR